MATNLQTRLWGEFESKQALEVAREHAFAYLDGVLDQRVFPATAALADLSQFDEALPDLGCGGSAIVDELARHAGGTIASQGGRYFGLVVGGVLPAALAARWLADAWNQNSALHRLSPVTSKLESVCEAWLKDIFGLPRTAVAGFVSGSSMAIFGGLAAGRERIFRNKGWDINAKGLRGAPPVRIVAGRHAHATVVKAVAILGFGIESIEWVDVDDQGRIIADKVPPLDDSSLLILQAGNVNSGSFDPFRELCAKAEAAGSWVHVDGAFGLWAAASRKLSHLTDGIELAHSWAADGHKTLNTPLDCGILLCRDREALVSALQASGSYIVYSEERDGMLFTPEMSRRARVIEAWAALKSLGKNGLEELVDQLHSRAGQMAAQLERYGFEILNDVVFNQVLVACETDDLTDATIVEVQDSGECWAGGATWLGRKVIRVSICSWATTEADIDRSARAFRDARDRVQATETTVACPNC